MNIYQHFRPGEREFIDQVLNWKDTVESTYALRLTHFLDPREQHILKLIIGESGDVRVELYGGVDSAERKRALLLPDYAVAEPDDFQVSLMEIKYPVKFVSIEHPQVLGSLMSLGLKREKFGDILTSGDRVQFLCASEVASYITMQLESVGRASVSVSEVKLDDAIIPSETWTEDSLTVSSLRLDAVLAAIHHISRQKSQVLIQQGLVKVNWAVTENPAFECGEGDIISARGYGRARIQAIEGKTKKDKWRITAGKQK
ncbi:RNA-binding protein [Bacillus sp. FJAT-27225]|uniref:YlmH family RNA-binding protein n=1 Tax=Bacillus sp. FJAT-27225 TaxID=1743144 RepID=UPI00080C2345|nr:RNA-binding protein [Bacillus sp. FJAT-27225]OCA85520.1 RNA-binding protein [Bacillus sp. FJAT-27225]